MDSELNTAYADFLKSKPWHYFATVTFRRERHDTLAAIKAVDLAVANLRERAFWAVEPHRTGALHLHGLIKCPDAMVNGSRGRPMYPATQLWRRFFAQFGRARVEVIRGQEDVTGYCSKYVTKSGGFEYDFTGRPENW